MKKVLSKWKLGVLILLIGAVVAKVTHAGFDPYSKTSKLSVITDGSNYS